MIIKISVRGELAKQENPSAHGHRFLIKHIKFGSAISDTSTIWQNPDVRSSRLQVSFKRKGGDEIVAALSSMRQSEEIRKTIDPSSQYKVQQTSEILGESAVPEKAEAMIENMEQYKHLHDALSIEYVVFAWRLYRKYRNNSRQNVRN